MTEGYRALTRAAAVIDLTDRTRIRATGEDRARLLHAVTTNHIQQLLPGHGCYAFFLNANGRILADANILVSGDHILIDSEPEVRESLYAHLDHYIIADDVTLSNDSETTFSLGVEGPGAHDALKAAGIPPPAGEFAHLSWEDLMVARLTATGEPGFRIFGPLERKRAVLDLLYLGEATPHDSEVVRVEHAHPRFGVDFTIANLTAETGLTQALHFQKGCYLGQEIVERVRSRGHVNKRLVALVLEGHEAPAQGAKILVDGKEAGEVTSAVFSPALHKIAAIGLVRVPHDRPGVSIEAGGVAGSVRAVIGPLGEE